VTGPRRAVAAASREPASRVPRVAGTRRRERAGAPAQPAVDSTELIAVGRLRRAHGIRGELLVEVRTEAPNERFAPGTRLLVASPADPSSAIGELVVEAARWHSGSLIVRFAGVTDRTAAEQLRGLLLSVPENAVGDAGPGAWWDSQLIGLRATLRDGTEIGEVTEVVHLPVQDLLAVHRADGGELLVPFVAAIVPVVDVPGGRVVLDPPAGLLEL
jgi:16S rRNA processing protein RimM